LNGTRGDHERKDAEDLGDRQFNLEVRGESKMGECAFGSVGKRKMVVEHEVDDAEQHDGEHESGAGAVHRAFPFRQSAARVHG
jgi:hypothetical protein